MNKRAVLRLISLAMLIIAVIFVFCALSSPTLGSTVYIGKFQFGAEQWRVCYKAYGLVVICLFAASFVIKRK